MRRLYVALLTLAAAFTGAIGHGQTYDLSQLRATSTFTDGVQAYIYGYPLVLLAVTQKSATAVATAGDRLGAAPLNQFGKETQLPNSSFNTVVLPSTSTLYASSFLNLSVQPVVLHIPQMNKRFFILQMLDGWTNVTPKSPGSRLGSEPGDYALVGPHYTKTLPPQITHVIRMDTDTMWIIGRIYTNGSPQDIETVVDKIYPGLTLTPLDHYGDKDYTPPSMLPIDPTVDTVTTPPTQVANMDACAFFGLLASLMKYNPALIPQDAAIVPKLRQIGLTPGKSFNCAQLSPLDHAALQLAVLVGRDSLGLTIPEKPTSTGWIVALDVGTYGNKYYLRAQVAKNALGANNPVDAVYGYTTKDGAGNALTGNGRYVIHFSKTGQTSLPPVNGFWSLTIYNNPSGTLVPNTVVNYNAIGEPYVQNHHACYNSDGSLDLYLQSDPPPSGKPLCNWLPTPQSNGAFIAFLRMYWPQAPILNSTWIPPTITRTN